MNRIKSKRGLSPLISTILLISLAAAVGVSFVTYAGSYFEKKSLEANCADVPMNILELNKNKTGCLSYENYPYSIKFGSDEATDCYNRAATGKINICDSAKSAAVQNAWVPSKDLKI